MPERVDAGDITLGMFVSELDRPWIGTPFLLQGFIVDSEEQINLLREYCRFVYVDRHRSVGDAYRAPEHATPERQASGAIRRPLVAQSTEALAQNRKRGGLRASLKAIWAAAFQTADHPPEARGARDIEERAVSDVRAFDSARATVDASAALMEAERAALQNLPPRPYSGTSAQDGSGFLSRLRDLFSFRKRKTRSISTLETPGPDVAPGPSVYIDQVAFEEELPKATAAHKRSEEAISTIIRDISESKPLAMETAEEAVAWMVESIVRNPDSLTWLVRLKTYNQYTYDHALKVAVYLLAFGRHLQLPKIVLQALGMAGLLQDLGKIRVPSAVLEKSTPLSTEECELLKEHVFHSMEIVRSSKNVSPMVLEIIAQHHERYDGSGYPHGLKGEQLSMFGAMAGLVDTYVAMTSARPYGSPLSPHEAREQLWRGQAFSPSLVQEFISSIGVYPVGTLVELNTGETAVVLTYDRTQRYLPRVMLIHDQHKKPYAKPITLDLKSSPVTPGGEAYRIIGALHSYIAGEEETLLALANL